MDDNIGVAYYYLYIGMEDRLEGKHKEEMVSVRQAARECGRNTETVRRWIWSGKLPAEKLGNQLFIKREDFNNYCRETAVAYDARPRPNASNGSKPAVKRDYSGEKIMGTTERTWNTTADISHEREMKLSFLKKAVSIRNQIQARTSEAFDIESIIRELRDERKDELG